MKHLKTRAASSLFLVAAALALAPLASAADPVRERIDGFKASQRSVATIEDAIAQGDKLTVAEQARVLAVFAENIPDLYPADATGGFFSKAKGDIWKNFPDFVSKAQAFKSSAEQLEQAAASSSTDVSILSQRLRSVKNSCTSCHQNYKRGR
ncbi:cytochrome c [Xanthomonas axonopodis pv. cassiae]|uniref:cytochrome c n=1 Tax=Xanthomonas axonopodis TaxID=53413 RepID=UPI003558F875